jgi:hypothetical protein
MGVAGGPDLIQDGLVLSLDASDRNSYVSGSTTWFDLSGNNLSETLTNGPVFTTESIGSIMFDGVDDYAQYPSRSTITEFQYSSSFTIECFAKIMENTLNGYLANNRAVDGNGTNYTGWGLLQSQGTILGFIGGYPSSVFDWRNVNTSTTDFNNTVFGKWAHIVWVNDGTLVGSKIYLNGINATSQSYDNNTPPYTVNYTGSHRLTLGMSPADGTPGGHFLSGSIAVARVYNKALSADEVLQNYNAQKSKFGL